MTSAQKRMEFRLVIEQFYSIFLMLGFQLFEDIWLALL